MTDCLLCGHPESEHDDPEFGCTHDFMKTRGGQELHDYTCSCLAFFEPRETKS